ncbi:uncharacterized protein LOC120623311 [Pararge aegeria]|uniref:Jg23760 protein n=1 Tax=Pararge aegeria aegeria TaxID=348720 RepID=A0A8S4SJU8_9NEOP|nr:uncharacterized protein LOC120623311 [Pararge aegeria]CAH2268736.1 jg23760 [Pararge aegeria aegeria]
MVFFYYIVLFAIAAVSSVDSVTPTNQLLEKQILSVLNKWREGGVQTNLFPLPPLNLININPIDSYYDQRGIKITFSIGDMKLRGLDNFTVEYLKVTQSLDDIRISVKVFVPDLTISSDRYNLKGRAYFLYPLEGFGKMSAMFRNVDASLSVNFANVGDVGIKIDDFILNFSAGSVDVDLENSTWPINHVLNKEGVEIIKNFHEDIVNIVQDYAVPYVNDYLAKVTPREFLKIATNIGENSYVINNNIK